MRSIVIMLSVALGLLAGIAVLALYSGMLRSRVRILIYEESGHLQIHDTAFKKDFEPAYVLKDAVSIINTLHSMPQVKSIGTRSITMGMLAATSGSSGVQVNGINAGEENEVSQLTRKIIEGSGFSPAKKNELIIGKKLAGKMKLKRGSKVVLTFTDSGSNIISGAFRVAAIFQSNNSMLDERNVYVKQAALNELLNIGSHYHEIAVILHKDEDVAAVQQLLMKKFPSYQVESWKEISPETELMAGTIDVYSYIIIVIIMFALAFGIINTMLMAILERTREIGMMGALGMSRVRIFLLILSETILLTITGAPIGLAAAWGLTGYFNARGLDLSWMGKELMRTFGYGTTVYPEFPSDKIIGILLIVVCTALISCLFPAIKALRLQPVKALSRFS